MTAITVSARPRAHPGQRLVAAELVELAHELRTPLSSVIGLSTILSRELHGPLNDKQAEYVDQIEAGGRHLLALITNLLDLAKAEAGKLEPQLADVQVADVIDEAVTMVRQLAADKQIAIRAGHVRDLPLISADRLRLKQVILNLLSNAIKFTDPGQRIGVHAHGEGGWVTVDVWDTGIGIAPEDLERVFEPFEQGNVSLSRREEGTGLGLPLSRRLTELQGGRLSVRSAPGFGSVFTVSFPVLDAAIPASPASRSTFRRSWPT